MHSRTVGRTSKAWPKRRDQGRLVAFVANDAVGRMLGHLPRPGIREARGRELRWQSTTSAGARVVAAGGALASASAAVAVLHRQMWLTTAIQASEALRNGVV